MAATPQSAELIQETLSSERRRVTVLAQVFGVAALVVPWFPLLLGRAERDWLGFGVSAGALALGFGYQVFLRNVLLRLADARRAAPIAARFLNSFAETLLATAVVFAFAHSFGPQSAVASRSALVFVVFIILAALRLNAWLCLFSGACAAASCLALRLLMAPALDSSVVGSSLAEGLLLAGCGALTAVVTVQIRERVEASFALVQERNRVLSVFGQHVSPAVVEHLLQLKKELGGELRFVCVMFLDIRDFTTFSEKRTPDEVVRFLNLLFDPMVAVVNRHHGIINKFLGDGFMAVFGAPIADEQECLHAVEAAREIIAGVEAQVAKGTIPATRVGIGLHAGQALTGTVGSAERREYTIIGDVVNLASRIESLNKQHRTQLLVSETVAARVPGTPMTSLGPTLVKGRETPIEVFELG